MMGLVPTFPRTADAITSVIQERLRIANVPAAPSRTGTGPMPVSYLPDAFPVSLPHATSRSTANDPVKSDLVIVLPLFRRVYQHAPAASTSD